MAIHTHMAKFTHMHMAREALGKQAHMSKTRECMWKCMVPVPVPVLVPVQVQVRVQVQVQVRVREHELMSAGTLPYVHANVHVHMHQHILHLHGAIPGSSPLLGLFPPLSASG